MGKVREMEPSQGSGLSLASIKADDHAMPFWESLEGQSIENEEPDFSKFRFGQENMNASGLESSSPTGIPPASLPSTSPWSSSDDDNSSLGGRSMFTTQSKARSLLSANARENSARILLKTPKKLMRSSLPKTFSLIGLVRQSSPPKTMIR